MGSSLIQVQLFIWLDSQDLHEIVALPTQKINFFTCPWSFTLRTITLWIKVGIVYVKENFHLTSWNLWSSLTVPEAEPAPVLTSAPELQTSSHNPWMNTCIQLTTAVYMHRGCNFAGFKPKCKTDFLPWLHHSKFFMQTQYNSEARVKFLKIPTVTATMTEQIKTANILFTHCFKTAKTKLLPCGLRSDEVKHLVQISRILGIAAKKSYFLVLLDPTLLFDPMLDKPVFWWSAHIGMVRKSHIREPGCYGMLLSPSLTSSQPCCFNRL